ncbi:MAG: hypothetical protein ACPHEP_06400 [Acidimicrobiales bacterium]
MPAKSKKQQRFMAAVANNPKFAKKVGVSQNVGEEFMKMKKYQKGGLKRQIRENRVPVGISNPQAGVTAEPMAPMARLEPRRISEPVGSLGGIAESEQVRMREGKEARRARRQQGRRGRGPGMKSGGKVRGCGMARQGVRKAKMVSMKGS